MRSLSIGDRVYTQADLYVLIKSKEAKVIGGLIVFIVLAVAVYMLKGIFYDVPKLKEQVQAVEEQIREIKSDLSKVKRAEPIPAPSFDQLVLMLKRLENKYGLKVISRSVQNRRVSVAGETFNSYFFSTVYRNVSYFEIKGFLEEVNRGWLKIEGIKTIGKNVEVKISGITGQ